MNLKESFRYQSFIGVLADNARRSIEDSEHCYKITKKHLRSVANSDANDEEEVVEVDEFFHNDDVLDFLRFIVGERAKLTKAIDNAKKSLEFDIDAAVETNKMRQATHNSIRRMLRATPNKRTETGFDYKFNVEGNQTSYRYNIEVVKELNFDADKAKKLMKELIAEADEASTKIDEAMITTKVDYEPPFDVNDSFEDVMEIFLESVKTTE